MLPLNYRFTADEVEVEPTALTELTNPVTRTQVKLSPPLLRGPDEDMDAFMARVGRISAAFDAFCVELWSFPSCEDPIEITFFRPAWMKDEPDDEV
jgi:hypothetical protein